MTPMAGLSRPGTGPSGSPPVPEAPVPWSARRQRLRRAVTGLAVVLAALLVLSVTGLLPVQVMRVGSESMSPTIATGDLVLLERGHHGIARMDVVVVERPDTGVLLVKRAVALGGDRVAIEDGVLVVNGAAVCEPAIDPERTGRRLVRSRDGAGRRGLPPGRRPRLLHRLPGLRDRLGRRRAQGA